MSDEDKRDIYLAVAEAQIRACKKVNGYFYWNYKLLTDTFNEQGWIGWDSWDFGRCMANGWFPQKGGRV